MRKIFFFFLLTPLIASPVWAESRLTHYLISDAKVPGTNYHATGNVPCSMGNGQPTGSCPFGVTRQGNGTADVTIKKPDGRSRVIFFKNGLAIAADVSQADPGEFSASKEADLFIIRIGKERYEIPEAVIFGG